MLGWVLTILWIMTMDKSLRAHFKRFYEIFCILTPNPCFQSHFWCWWDSWVCHKDLWKPGMGLLLYREMSQQEQDIQDKLVVKSSVQKYWSFLHHLLSWAPSHYLLFSVFLCKPKVLEEHWCQIIIFNFVFHWSFQSLFFGFVYPLTLQTYINIIVNFYPLSKKW